MTTPRKRGRPAGSSDWRENLIRSGTLGELRVIQRASKAADDAIRRREDPAEAIVSVLAEDWVRMTAEASRRHAATGGRFPEIPKFPPAVMRRSFLLQAKEVLKAQKEHRGRLAPGKRLAHRAVARSVIEARAPDTIELRGKTVAMRTVPNADTIKRTIELMEDAAERYREWVHGRAIARRKRGRPARSSDSRGNLVRAGLLDAMQVIARASRAAEKAKRRGEDSRAAMLAVLAEHWASSVVATRESGRRALPTIRREWESLADEIPAAQARLRARLPRGQRLAHLEVARAVLDALKPEAIVLAGEAVAPAVPAGDTKRALELMADSGRRYVEWVRSSKK